MNKLSICSKLAHLRVTEAHQDHCGILYLNFVVALWSVMHREHCATRVAYLVFVSGKYSQKILYRTRYYTDQLIILVIYRLCLISVLTKRNWQN